MFRWALCEGKSKKGIERGRRDHKSKTGVREKFNLHICSTQYLTKGTDWVYGGQFLVSFLKFCFPSGVDKGVSR